MRIVDHDERIVPVGQVADVVQACNDAVHREHAIGRDQLRARPGCGGLLESRLQFVEIVVRVAQALRLAEPDAVDDARVIERVADDGVVFVQQRLEQAAVGIEAR